MLMYMPGMKLAFSLLILLLSTPAMAIDLEVAMFKKQLIHLTVVARVAADGEVTYVNPPMTDEECEDLAKRRGGLKEPVLIEFTQKLDAEETDFNNEVMGRSVVSRRMQACFASEAQISK